MLRDVQVPVVPVIPPGLLGAASAFLGTPIRAAERMAGGYEAEVFLVEADTPVVLHLSPDWRGIAELDWVHSVVAHVHAEVPEAVPALRRNGRTVFEWEGRCAAVFPYVRGAAVPRGDPDLAAQAAGLLARIHVAFGRLQPAPHPSSEVAPAPVEPSPSDLRDPALDAWWRDLPGHRPTMGLLHGDYYGGNLIAAGGRIVGVVDWHESHVGSLALELAGASFEFCRDPDHRLDPDGVRRFVSTYRANGGPVSDWEIEMLPRFRAWWVREDARRALTAGAGGDPEYARRQVAAFQWLREGDGGG